MLRNATESKGIYVCGEVRKGKIHSVTMELIGKARELADKKNTEVTCILFCGDIIDPPEILFSYGADRVFLIKHEKLTYFNQEIAAKLLSFIIIKYMPEIVLAPATSEGRTYLPAVAAMVHTGLTADCTGLDIDPENGLLLQTRPAIGGNIMATIKTIKARQRKVITLPNFSKREFLEGETNFFANSSFFILTPLLVSPCRQQPLSPSYHG